MFLAQSWLADSAIAAAIIGAIVAFASTLLGWWLARNERIERHTDSLIKCYSDWSAAISQLANIASSRFKKNDGDDFIVDEVLDDKYEVLLQKALQDFNASEATLLLNERNKTFSDELETCTDGIDQLAHSELRWKEFKAVREQVDKGSAELLIRVYESHPLLKKKTK